MKLKPCPFCGGEAKEQNFIDPPFVCCTSCGGVNKSVEAWNRRKIDSDIVEEVKQAIRELCDVGEQEILDLYDVGEQVSRGLIDEDDDEEDLLEGDLEDQFERLMGGDI